LSGQPTTKPTDHNRSPRIEPDGQRPKVLLHGKACRKSANPSCAYAADDTRSTLEGVIYALDVKVGM
jgi:hypothetical protein